MIVLSFFVGLAVIAAAAAAARHLFYKAHWGKSPGEMDEDFEDHLTGWLLGALLALFMFCVAGTAVCIGGLVLGLACGPMESADAVDPAKDTHGQR